MRPYVIVRNLLIISVLLLAGMDYYYGINNLWYLVPVLIFLSAIAYGSYNIKLNFFTKAYHSTANRNNEIAITFDDGPHENTFKILDILKAHQARATFFLIGSQVEKHPYLVKRIISEGHSVGNHSFSHKNTFPIMSVASMVDEIRRTNQLIKSVTGVTVSNFRPPFGVTNPRVAKAIGRTNMKTIGWSIRSLDTMGKSADKVSERVISRLKPGAVVLLHDDREATSEILEKILLYADKHSLSCVTVEEIFNFE